MENKLQILLNTQRLILRLPNENDITQLQAFEQRNREHMSPWRSATGEQGKDHKAQLIQWEQEFKEGKSVRFLFLLKEDPEGAIIGFCNFSQIFRGPFQACYLGYHIDAAFQGKGQKKKPFFRGGREKYYLFFFFLGKNILTYPRIKFFLFKHVFNSLCYG